LTGLERVQQGVHGELTYIILIRPQSGQTQVGPLVSPHLFSSKHSGQIWNPHGQFQQKGNDLLQQWQTKFSPPRRRREYDLRFSDISNGQQ